MITYNSFQQLLCSYQVYGNIPDRSQVCHRPGWKLVWNYVSWQLDLKNPKTMAPFLSPIIPNPQAWVNISVALELKVQFHSEANFHLLKVKPTIIVIVVQKMECCSPPIRLWRDTVTGIWITCNQYITTACQYWWCLSMSPTLPALLHRLGCPLLRSHSLQHQPLDIWFACILYYFVMKPHYVHMSIWPSLVTDCCSHCTQVPVYSKSR